MIKLFLKFRRRRLLSDLRNSFMVSVINFIQSKNTVIKNYQTFVKFYNDFSSLEFNNKNLLQIDNARHSDDKTSVKLKRHERAQVNSLTKNLAKNNAIKHKDEFVNKFKFRDLTR